MKRNPTSELNHENWNEDDIQEERGTFSTASNDVIAKRKVISAKRKPAMTTTGLFKTFGGFEKTSVASVPLANDENKEKHLNNLKALNQTFLKNIEKFINENSCCILSPLFEDYQRHLNTIKNKYPLINLSTDNSANAISIKPSASNNSDNKNQIMPNLYQSNPLTFGKKEDSQKPFTFLINESAKVSIPSTFLSNESSKPEDSVFKFSNNSVISSEVKQTPFTFGSNDELSKPSTVTNTSLFGGSNFNTFQAPSTFNMFGTSKPNESSAPPLFGSVTFPTKAVDTTDSNNDDEEYVPPTAETREVKESDSVFDIRCKLFYQVEQAWKEKGVGNLFIKPLSSGKFQLVMRADNTLGVILLNVMITNAMPMSVNKNNVSLVAITDFVKPDLKPTPLLIRVKTAVDAEELLKAMKKQLE